MEFRRIGAYEFGNCECEGRAETLPAHQALIHPPGAKKSQLADGEPLKGGSPVSQLLLCSAAADRPNDLAIKPNVGSAGGATATCHFEIE
jgi:hypothetical protein